MARLDVQTNRFCGALACLIAIPGRVGRMEPLTLPECQDIAACRREAEAAANSQVNRPLTAT
jgi:hypothetical protein